MTLIPQIFSEKEELENKYFQVISCYSNWKEIDELELKNQDINLYFWMIYEGNNTFYSQDFIIWTIRNSLEKTKWNINIELWWELSKVMNSEISEWNSINNIENQKNIIRGIINKTFNKTEQERININILTSRHNDLLGDLEKENWFKVSWNFLEEIKNIDLTEITSLDIYKILYLESQKNDKLFKLSADIQTTHIKEKRNERASYYSIAEVAIRLKDLIDWKVVQWWENRQKRYDIIINKLLNKEFNSEILEVLYKLLEENNIESEEFIQFYINKKQLKEEKNNDENLKKIKKKIRNFIWKTTLAVSLVIWWGYSVKNHFDNIREERFDAKINKSILDNYPNIEKYHDMWMYSHGFNIDEYDINTIKWYVDDLTRTFISLYWDYNINVSWEEYKNIYFLILNEFLNWKDFFKERKWDYYEWNNQFLEEFIKNNNVKLLQEWYNLDKNNLTKYKKIISNTANLIEKEIDSYFMNFSQSEVNEIWIVNIDYSNYELWLVQINWTNFIVARVILDLNIKDKIEIWPWYFTNPIKFSLKKWMFLSKDILKYIN